MCEICNNESGGVDIGVACVPGVPMSVMYCRECLMRHAFPSFVFDHDFIFLAEGDLSHLGEWTFDRLTWIDGKYETFQDYVKRITPERVKEELKKYREIDNGLPSS